jgi:hypothetical protein
MATQTPPLNTSKPPLTEVTNCKKSERSGGDLVCACSWEECKEWCHEFQRRFGAPSETNVADGASNSLHPWAGSLVSINIVNGRNTGHKKLLLRAGIVRKLTLDESKLEQPTLYVTPHHWPISLVHQLAPPSRTTLLSLNLAKTIQDTDGHSRLTDPLYRASSLAKKHKISMSSNGDLNKFIQTPVSEHAEVESVYESLFNNRSERLASRRSINIMPAAPQQLETAMSRDDHDISLCSRPPEAEISKNSFDTAVAQMMTTIHSSFHFKDTLLSDLLYKTIF